MALNYLLHRHQISLVRAQSSATAEGRIAHGKMADAYAERIRTASELSGGGTVIAALAL